MARIQYGTTWWGKAWLDALSNIDYSNRLGRGRSYYSSGRIESVEFQPDTLTVEAIVSGSAYYPYEVSIRLKALPENEVDRLVDAVAERPALVAKLLNNELDPEVAEIAESLGIHLFPQSWREFDMYCSCPDSAVPCKHLAAVYYAIVKTIDADPMWVFTCRGVDLTEKLKSRGINLESAVRIEDPMWVDWLKDDGERETIEGMTFETLPLYRLRPLATVLTGLLPTAGGPKKELTRAKAERHYAKLQRWAFDREGNSAPDAWAAWEREYGAGPVIPTLNWYQSNPEIGMVRRKTEKHCILMPEARAKMLAALCETTQSEAEGHSKELLFWVRLSQTALALFKHGAVVPRLCRMTEGTVGVYWMPAQQSPEVDALISDLTAAFAASDFTPAIPPEYEATPRGKVLAALGALLTAYEGATQSIEPPSTLTLLWGAVVRPAASFRYGIDAEAIQALRKWLAPLSLGQRSFVWSPALTVRAGREDDVTVNLGILPRKTVPNARPVLYRELLKNEKYADERFAMISVFENLAAVCPEVSCVIQSSGSPAHLPLDSLRDFLFDAVPALEMLGARVVLPKRLERLLRPQLQGSLSGMKAGAGVLTKEALSDFSWEISIGEHKLTREEFEKLLESKGKVIRWEDDFVYLDPAMLEAMRATLDKKRGPSYLDRVRALLSGELNGCPVVVSHELTERVRALCEVEEVQPPKGLRATLRPYQVRGYAWLMKNLRLGIGSLIADDMGLGKTLQVIAALLALKEAGELQKGKVLAALPTTLLTNWSREIARFAPDLTVGIYHGTARSLPPLEVRPDVTLTTYGLLRRDLEKLVKEPWRVLVLDEAQAVKNSSATVTQAVRMLPAKSVIAMSGTPVENRLTEYWSLFSIVQPGLLGSEEEFRTAFALPIETNHDPKALTVFRKLTTPFMLRRVKTDRSIIADLPEKIESNRYADLTPVQAVLYQQTLEKMLGKIRETEAEGDKAKRGMRVMALITALKQICNSPSQYEKTLADTPDSGKGTALLELLDECRESRRKVLVFTQYREMGERLQRWIENAFGKRPDFLHGGVPIKTRGQMVDDFQTDPSIDVLIVSLKAGGTGLNLTAASAVIHYDLWWNPAVENQATDRAYRIGQKRDVLVYRFLCAGTFEEKINDMLTQKRELAELTVGRGENWIGDLPSDELAELFSLWKTNSASLSEN